MHIFEKIKGLIVPHGPNSLFGYDIHLDTNNTNDRDGRLHVDKTKKIVTFYLNNLSPKESRVLKKAIKLCFDNNGVLLTEESKLDLIDRLYKYNDKDDNRILSFFKEILPNRDWQVLRDSLFLRSEFKNSRTTYQLKNEIILRYGERGRNISNLCTAGYFEETMIPLYNSNKTEFFRYYDIAVDRGITAIFVNSNMSVSKIGEEIKRKLLSSKAYGLSNMHIHGIGDNNIRRIKQCIEKEKETIGFTVKTSFEDKALHVYVAEIIF